jgi:hypothetical protein
MANRHDRADPKRWLLCGLVAGVILQVAKMATSGKTGEDVIAQGIGYAIGMGVLGYVAALIKNRYFSN